MAVKKTVAVLGAGMVGTACALALQRRGFDVALIDRLAPGRETSYGNAGVLARSSLVPMNHPGLWAALPRLAQNRSVQLRYRPGYLVRNLPWMARFLYHARQGAFETTARALDALIQLSIATHRRWLADAGALARLRSHGWMFLYRSQAGFDSSLRAREAFARFGVDTELLSPEGLQALEPALRPIFAQALWIKDAASVDNPGALVDTYAGLLQACGGRIVRGEVGQVQRAGDGWQVHAGAEQPVAADALVVALGPWSKDFLRAQFSLSVPMAYERGYHRHFAPGGGPRLTRPVYDAAGGYVLSPMEMGMRLTSGVELAALDAPPNPTQLELAARAAREAVPLGAPLEREAWLGRRPTLPDSRPVIGEARAVPGLWFAFGHQHIGLSTGPGTGCVLADLMTGSRPAIDAAAFAPARFGL